ncbi:hypothetical protein MtrunA17_Chr5g0412661 [Medicago truncatula]|uniref:Transmembrane protein n=1 Tax=Medicago truncatula TaxID=3880 RepID=A0A396HNS4_MEDTR|nr:hypothetical protein MtrunA17_Chr5g0412661 [Medicago truncatula]
MESQMIFANAEQLIVVCIWNMCEVYMNTFTTQITIQMVTNCFSKISAVLILPPLLEKSTFLLVNSGWLVVVSCILLNLVVFFSLTMFIKILFKHYYN